MSKDSNLLYNCWFDVLEEYSRRHLTFVADRLPALAGITNEFAHYLEDQSIHGLWRNDLHRGLLFMQIGWPFAEHDSDVRPLWDQSPSWSWVAVGSPVTWIREIHNADMKRVCDVELLNYPATSTLQLRGTLLTFPSSYSEIAIHFPHRLSGYYYGPVIAGFYFEVWLDHWVDFTIDLVSISWTSESSRAVAFAEGIVMMPVLWYIAPPHLNGSPRKATVACLVLQPQTGSQRGVYRRLGVAHASKRGRDEADIEVIKSQVDALRTPLQAHLFQKEDRDSKYTIAII